MAIFFHELSSYIYSGQFNQVIVFSQLVFQSHVSVLFGFEKNLWSHYHWFNFDFFYEPSSYIHYLSIQPVYVNQWLHNHLANLCNVPSGNWDFSEFCQSNISPLVSSETSASSTVCLYWFKLPWHNSHVGQITIYPFR